MTFSVSSPIRRTLLSLAVAIAPTGLWSCQGTDPEPAEARAERATFSVDKSYREPDAATWAFKGQTGAAQLAIEPKTGKATATFTLPAAPGAEPVELWTWKYGVRFAKLTGYGEGELKIADADVVREEPAGLLLRRHDSLARIDPLFYERNPLGVRRLYAKMLVEGDSAVAGYPERKPHGIDSVALVDEICLAMARAGRPFSVQVSSKFLGQDSATWHTAVLERISRGTLGATDSVVLFPPAPVRVTVPVSVVADPVAGGDEVEIRGTFAWNPGLVAIGAEVLKDGAVVLGGFDASIAQPSRDADTIWKLDGRSTLRARAKTPAGLYTLRLVARDAKGNRVSSQDTFRVATPPPGTPRLVRVLPVSQDSTVLDFDSSFLRVVVKVLNPQEIDTASFKVNGQRAQKLSDSLFQAQVPLAPSGEPQIVTMKVAGRNGLVGSDYLVATRRRDTLAPSIQRGSGASDRSVPFDSTLVHVSWTVSDNHRLERVSIGDSVVSGIGATYGRLVRLGVGGNAIAIEARDSSGNVSRDSIRLVRSPDKTNPVIELALGNQDRVVTADSAKILVAWNVTDNHKLAKVLIGDTLAFGGGGLYYRFATLAMGENVVRVVAWDSTGNRATDSVTIVRLANPDRPVIQRAAGAADRVVPFDSSEVRVGWRVLNNSNLRSVRIDSIDVPGVGRDYSAPRRLVVGRNLVRFEAVDSAGRSTRDSIVVERRADSLAPVLARGPSSFEVVGDSILVTASWVATDNHRVASVRIQGVAVDAVATIYSRRFLVPASTVWVGIVAQDSTGNSARDSLAIHRATDSLAPVVKRGLGARSRTVAQDTASILVSWNVVDDQKLSCVTIGGDTIQGAGGVFGKYVALGFGTNRIVLRAMDLAGNEALDTVVVQRVDTSAPVLRKLSPSKDTTVAESADSIVLAIGSSDNSGSVKVTLDGAALVSDGTLFLKKVALNFGRNRFEVKSVDSSGNAVTDSFAIVRPDLTAPVAKRVVPLADTSVLDATDSVVVAWDVSDNASLATVSIDGRLGSGVSGRYSRKVGLAYGANIVRLVATDASGNQRRDSLRVARLDGIAPSLVRQKPLRDTMLDAFATTASVAWKVADNLKLGVVRINGVIASGAGGVYSATLPMSLGRNLALVSAIDSAGNEARDSLYFVTGRPAIAAGGYFGLYLDATGTVIPWGAMRVPALSNVVAIAAGDLFGMALHQDGSVDIWDTTSAALKTPASWVNVRKIAAGYTSAIGIKADSSVVLYGGAASLSVPVAGTKVIHAAVGNGFYVIVKADSTVNLFGTGATAAATPSDLGKVKAVWATYDMVTALRVNGELVTWGAISVSAGQAQTAKPADSSGVRQCVSNRFHAFGVKESGELFAWGYNGYGQAAIPATAPTDFVAVAAGYRYNVGLRANGLLYAWGERNYGASVVPANLASP